MKVKIFNQHVPVTKSFGFSKKFKGPYGSMVTAHSKWNDPHIQISLDEAVKAGLKDLVLQIPFDEQFYTLAVGSGPKLTVGDGPKPLIIGPGPKPPGKDNSVVVAVIPGPKPPKKKIGFGSIGSITPFTGMQTAAVFPGPRPRKFKLGANAQIVIGGPKPLSFILNAPKGSWHLEPDLDAKALNVKYIGPKLTKDFEVG